MRLRNSLILAFGITLGCGGSQPTAEVPTGSGGPADPPAAKDANEPPADGAGAPAGGMATDKASKASGAGGAPAGAPARPSADACKAVLDHMQSVSSEAIDRQGMGDACLNQWTATQIDCFKAAKDDATLAACWPAHK